MHSGVRLSVIGAICVSLACSAFAAEGEENEKHFTAGAATTNITPPLGVDLAGQLHNRIATYVHDELHARCLVLSDGTIQIAIVIVDSCKMPASIVDPAKKRIEETVGIPGAQVLIAATHTHTGPCTIEGRQSKPDPEYVRFQTSRIVDAVRIAVENMVPAEIAWGTGTVADEVFNRRWRMKPGTIPPDPFGGTTDLVKTNPSVADPNLMEPAGPTDPEVAFVAVRKPGGSPIALLANYSLHYVGEEGEETHVSADYFGYFARSIETLLKAERQDPPFVGILSNGTSGDINNIDRTKEKPEQEPYTRMQQVGDKLAKEVYRVYRGLQWKPWVSLNAALETLDVAVRLPSLEEVEDAKARLAKAPAEGLTDIADMYALDTVRLANYPAAARVVLQALRIGDVGIAAIPCEVFCETGLALKSESVLKPTFTIELANGYGGYLPTREQHELGGYETWRCSASFLAVDAEEQIRAAALRLLAKVAETEGN
ncbi:MAG: hypothetical protein K1Y02_04435 [Candidatus Hydrogenedentes bacterium]|nr:hypothetical protein [Candidatus Hydrogenedentota bacterium]